MPKNALEIMQDAAVLLNLPVPSTIVGADANTPILLRLANKSGEQMMRRHNWQTLTVQHTWVTAAAEAQPLALPAADYDRLAYNVLVWDRSGNRPLSGPTSSRMWTALKNGAVITSVIPYWRIINGVLNVFPAPEAGLTFGLEYISKKWAASSGGSPKDQLMDNSDVPRLPDFLFVDELVWRWRHSKGFDYADDMKTSEYAIERACSQDRGTGLTMPDQPADPVGDMMNPTWPGVIVP